MKKTLTIGEMSNLFQMNIQTLHYYDSIGLFVPAERDPETGHRRYEFGQVYQLAYIRYMRKLGYSLNQIAAYMDSRDKDFTLGRLKEQARILRKKWEELMNIETAIQRKIRFIEQEMQFVAKDSVTIREFPDRWYIPIGSEELLYGHDSFYLYPTVVFYEGETKSFGAYLFSPDEEPHLSGKKPGYPQASLIPAGKFLCGYHFGPYEEILESARKLREAGGDLVLDHKLVNFNIVDQFVERDSTRYITQMQLRIIE